MGSKRETKSVPPSEYATSGFSSHHREDFIAYIIFVLICAVLIPVFSVAREKARQSSCASNLKMTGLALLTYVEDYDGMSPPLAKAMPDSKPGQAENTPPWCDLLVPYRNGGISACPERAVPSGLAAEMKDKPQASGYAYNGNLAGVVWLAYDKTAPMNTSIKWLKTPELTVAVFDARVGSLILNAPDVDKAGENQSGITPGATRHRGGANYLFGDGHVNWFVRTGLTTGEKGDGIHPGFGL